MDDEYPSTWSIDTTTFAAQGRSPRPAGSHRANNTGAAARGGHPRYHAHHITFLPAVHKRFICSASVKDMYSKLGHIALQPRFPEIKHCI